MASIMKEFESRLKKLCEDFEAFKNDKKVPEVGGTVEIADKNWIILDKLPEGYLALSAESIGNKIFGSNNDWRESDIRKYLNGEFAEKIEKEIGVPLPEFERDLLSLDGQTEYGTCKDKASLITLDEYRKYRQSIKNESYYWWTCTPDSTPCNNDKTYIRVVCPSGVISYDDNCYDCRGVRPICIFPSSLFESEE